MIIYETTNGMRVFGAKRSTTGGPCQPIAEQNIRNEGFVVFVVRWPNYLPTVRIDAYH